MADFSGQLVRQSHSSKEGDHSFGCGWYYPREHIEQRSFSRRDGISPVKENQLRKSYCVFLQDLGMRLKLPQLTIATSIVFCHRFFLRQSHAKNDRFLIATACMFLAGKVEETPKLLQDVLTVSYEIRHKRDKKAAAQRIQQKKIYEYEKECVLLAEHVVLQTLGFDLNIVHPYRRLVTAVKKLEISDKSLAQVAWNFVNDALRTSLCLQYEAHCIAAGAIFLAAKFLRIKLPADGEKPWWQVLEVSACQLEDVSNQMLELYEQHQDTASPTSATGSVAQHEVSPGTPQAVEKTKFEVQERAEPKDEDSQTQDLLKSPCISNEKASIELAELNVEVTRESNHTHSRCGSKHCCEPEPKRPRSSLMA